VCLLCARGVFIGEVACVGAITIAFLLFRLFSDGGHLVLMVVTLSVLTLVGMVMVIEDTESVLIDLYSVVFILIVKARICCGNVSCFS
jgi:hypothetical protein